MRSGEIESEREGDSGGRPHRFTFRDLFVLVAAEADESDRRAYLRQTFDWYFNRTRDQLVAAVAAAVGLLIAVGTRDALGKAQWLVLAGVGAVVFVLTVLYFWMRSSLKPLHREYLCCLIVMQRLATLSEPLRLAFHHVGATDEPTIREPSTYLPWHGSLLWDKGRVLRRLEQEDELASDELEADPKSLARGRYLFEVLGRVPTDAYERQAQLRAKVDEIIRRATRLQQP